MRRPRPTRRPTIALLVISFALAGSAPARAAPCWEPPVSAPVAEGFDAPDCRWCAGHRGLEYAPTTGLPARAVAAGTVTFAGLVAGVRYVTVDHGDGIRATYGWLRSMRVATGASVQAGDVVGHGGPRLMFTLRRQDEYLDPALFLGRIQRRPWLVPASGAAGRTPPAGRLVCPLG